jgi:hypothetical protein
MKTAIQLNGRHRETGSIHNALALQGGKAPYTRPAVFGGVAARH